MNNLVNHFIENHSKNKINSTDKLKRATFFKIIDALIVLQRLPYFLPLCLVTINNFLFTVDNTIRMTSTFRHII